MRGTVVGLCVSVCVCYQSKGCLINLRNNLSIPDDHQVCANLQRC